MASEPGVGCWADPETLGHTHGGSFQVRESWGSSVSPGPTGRGAAGPGKITHGGIRMRTQDQGLGWGCSEAGVPPGLGATKRSAATGSGRGGHRPSTHGQSVGPEGADGGLSPPIRIPTPRVSSLGCPRGAKVLAVSTGERQDACDSGVHKTPSRAWTLGLTSLLGSALPNPRTREPGRAHPAPSSASPVTLPRPLSPLSPAPGASAAGPLGHTSWARPPALSPQVPPRPPPSASAPASAAPGEVVAGPPSQPTSTPGRPRLAWVLGRGSHSTGSASQEPRGSPGGTQPHGAGCNTDPTHLPL